MTCFFFFQAEDGIRDSSVTGVQTCALPISCRRALPACFGSEILRKGPAAGEGNPEAPRHQITTASAAPCSPRSRGTPADRKSVVLGKSVDLRGRPILKKKNENA